MTDTAVAAAPADDLAALKFRLNFFKLIVRDIDAMVDFYKTTFGFTETNRITLPGLIEAMLVLPEQTFNLVLYKHTDGREIEIGSGHGPVGFVTRDADAAFARAVAKGATPVREPFSGPGMRIAFVNDPEGHEIEFIQIVRPAAPKE